MPFPVIISADAVPSGFCPISNSDFQFLVSLMHASISGDPSWNIGNATPDPNQRGAPWLRYNSDGTPDRVYSFVNGIWQSPHLTPPGIVSLYRGDASLIDALDGGSAGAVTPIAGPFWARVTEINGRFPISPGTMPSGLVINVTDTGGNETHMLTADEGPAHTHKIANSDIKIPRGTLTDSNNVNLGGASMGGSPDSYQLSGTSGDPTLGVTSQAGGQTAFSLMPPWYGIYFLERTLRQFYVQAA